MSWERPNRAERPGFTDQELKVCDLCGALNLAASRECVICGWSGRFDYDPDVVRAAMDDFRRTFDRADAYVSGDVVLEEYLSANRPRSGGIIAWLKKLFGKPDNAFREV